MSKGTSYDTKTLIMVFYCLGGIAFCLKEFYVTCAQVKGLGSLLKGPRSLFLLRPRYCPKKDPHSVDPAKATALTTMKRLIIVKELNSLLGRVSYIRQFIPGLASITNGLTKLLKKGVKFTWGAEQQYAF